MGEAVRDMGCDVGAPAAFIAISFPPALCNSDKNLQRAHCRLALGCSEGYAMAAEATTNYAKELLGDSIDQLLEWDSAEMDSILAGVDALVKDALEALRKTQCIRRESECIASYVIDALICRLEWRAVEAQVNAWGQERRRDTKHSNRRKAKKDCNATAQTSPSLSFAVRELQSRT